MTKMHSNYYVQLNKVLFLKGKTSVGHKRSQKIKITKTCLTLSLNRLTQLNNKHDRRTNGFTWFPSHGVETSRNSKLRATTN